MYMHEGSVKIREFLGKFEQYLWTSVLADMHFKKSHIISKFMYRNTTQSVQVRFKQFLDKDNSAETGIKLRLARSSYCQVIANEWEEELFSDQ